MQRGLENKKEQGKLLKRIIEETNIFCFVELAPTTITLHAKLRKSFCLPSMQR
jgi:hypothetical protein